MKPRSDAVLDVQALEAGYEASSAVLNGVNIQVGQGEIVALLGANGAGKSTTLKAISGLIGVEGGHITHGSVLFDGHRVDGLSGDQLVSRGLFQVMEGRRIIENMTVYENLQMGAYSRAGRASRQDIDRVYSYFPRLKERKGLAGYLSGGEQQMLAIGRAIMARPRLILLDEPSMGLSPLMVQEVFAIISDINRREGIGVLLVEQNADVALRIAGSAYIMEGGRIVMEGSSENLRNSPEVQEHYLGGDQNQRVSFRGLKSYRAAQPRLFG